MDTPPLPPLADLRVLDLSTVLAGPNCARYLADFGADVIKVEQPDGGDTLRNMAWRDPRDGEGLWWKLVNRNKRTIALDLKDHRRSGRAAAPGRRCQRARRELPARHARAPRSRPRQLLARNPRLVITRITGFGQDGPYANRPGFATVAEAMSGLSAINGEPDGQPLLPPIALTDEVTGLVAAFATMVALHSGRRPGRRRQPAREHVSDDGAADLPVPADRRTATAARRRPSLHRARAGPTSAATGSGSACRRAATASRRASTLVLGVGDDPRFTTFAGRWRNRDELEAMMVALVRRPNAGRGARRVRARPTPRSAR